MRARARVLYKKVFPYTHHEHDLKAFKVHCENMTGANVRMGMTTIAKVKKATARNGPTGRYVDFELEMVDDVEGTGSPGLGHGFKFGAR